MIRYNVLVMMIGLLTSLASADTFYISVGGKSENDGSRGKPWPSLAQALDKVKGGHTFIFLPGVYRGPIEIPDVYSGTEQAPNIIRSEDKWKAVVIGGTVHNMVTGDHCNWTVIDGFEVLGARGDGIKSDAEHTVIRNCWVHHNTQMGIAMHHAKNATIENNLIEFNGCHVQFDHGVYADGDGLTITGNVIRHNAAFGLHLYPAIQNSLVTLNLVYGQEHHAGVLVSCAKGGGPNRVIQNTIVGNETALEIWNGANTVIANNVLTARLDPIALKYDAKAATIDYNLCWPKSNQNGPHGASADPLFADPRKGLFWLKTGSPAISAGSVDFAPPADFWGRPIARSATIDLGAFVYSQKLLDPKSRSTWFHDWAYGYQPHQLADMPDLWGMMKTH